MTRKIFFLAFFSIFIGLAGCNNFAVQPNPLRVAAAADLDPALREIVAQFEKERGISVNVIFGSTGALTRQIEQGAPIDVFLSASPTFVTQLAKKGLIAENSIIGYGIGKIVIWQRADATSSVQEIGDLASPNIKRIAIANPEHAPYGQAAKEFLVNAGLWASVEKKLVFGENVGEALQFARTGNADAAIVGRSQTHGLAGRYCAISDAFYVPLCQTLCIVRSTAREADARAFSEYVTGARGRETLRSYGIE